MAVVKFSGADRYFSLSGLTGRFHDSAGVLPAWVTPGITRGHAAAADAFGVAAAPAAEPLDFDLEPGDPPNPSGPFPGVFTRAQLPERFTSDGPRRVFFNADGSPITPGNFSSTGGAVRQKPELTAADGVSTGVDGFETFFGTSAAAPHAAAIAALVFEGNPNLTTADLRSAFAATDLDLKPNGVDGRSGTGVTRADRLLNFTGATPPALIEAGAPTVTPRTGDGDPYLEPGERATVALPLTNNGDGPGQANVTATIDDPQATLTPRVQSYATIAAGATRSRNFTLTLPSSYPRGKPLALDVRVEFPGTLSPTSARFRITTGQPAAALTTFAFTGPPVEIPDDDPAGVSVPIEVTGMRYAAALTFSIDGTACTTDEGAMTVGLDHTFVRDLVGTLTAPDGSHATLFSRSGEDGHNLCQVVFDDAAARPFAEATADDAPFIGSWRPDEPLADLLFGAVDGTWTFHVADVAPVDTGSIRAVSLHLRGLE
jgi:subtilisin-like proprotein convertase family protein